MNYDDREIFCHGRRCDSRCPFSETFATYHGIFRKAKHCDWVDEEYKNKVCAIWLREHKNIPDVALVESAIYHGIDIYDFIAKFQDVEYI